MNLPREKVSKCSRLCSVHFTADSYKESVLSVCSKILKKEAVPSIINMSDEEIKMIESVNEETESSNVKENDCEEEQSKMEEVADAGEEDEQTLENGSDNEQLDMTRSFVDVEYLDDEDYDIKFKDIKNVKWEDVSHSRSLSKAAFEEAKDTIRDLEKKLQIERVRNCRLKKIVKSFRALMGDLK
ncbi:uncharacterized protein LOC117167607 isoform X2 [Belonocnema kinseyi]|nr:uncharacterized protein LOC117167607 isoform X2 [Belonocnema kinseyi]